MSTSLRIGPYRFFFHAGDGNAPAHTHVQRDDVEAKFWLAPVRLGFNRGFSASELRRIERMTEEHESKLLEEWHEYFDVES